MSNEISNNEVEETGLATSDLITSLPMSKYSDDRQFSKEITSLTYLPRIQLFGSTSDAVKEDKIRQGRYGYVRSKEIQDLGAEVNCLPIAWRFKAMSFSDEVISAYDPNSELYKQLKAKSQEKNSGCMYGVEFLLYLYENKQFATYYMSSISSRNEAPSLRGLIGKPTTLKVKLAETKKYKWHVPVVVSCSTPFEPPIMSELMAQAESFANPKESETELVDEKVSTAAGTDRAR